MAIQGDLFHSQQKANEEILYILPYNNFCSNCKDAENIIIVIITN